MSPRELATRFTDTEGYFVSESSVYRLLKAHDLITSPAFVVIKVPDQVAFPSSRASPARLEENKLTAWITCLKSTSAYFQAPVYRIAGYPAAPSKVTLEDVQRHLWFGLARSPQRKRRRPTVIASNSLSLREINHRVLKPGEIFPGLRIAVVIGRRS